MKFYEGEYAVRMVPFPGDIYGCVKLTRDGTDFPNIYINDQLSPDARRRAYDHEMRHLENDDFYNDRPIDDVEEPL